MGLTLVEVVVSTLLVALVLVGALKCVGSAVHGRTVMGNSDRAEQLAAQLMAEILDQHYVEPVDPPQFGRESESGAARDEWDDVDDYHLWSGSPPTDKAGTDYSHFDGWRREVHVEWVDPRDPATTVGTDQGVKRVTVTVQRGGQTLAQLVGLRSDKYPAARP